MSFTKQKNTGNGLGVFPMSFTKQKNTGNVSVGKNESLKCKKVSELKERGASPFLNDSCVLTGINWFVITQPAQMFTPRLPFKFQFHCLLFKTSERSRIFRDWAKSWAVVKNYFGDFDPSSRYLSTVFNFLMYNKRKLISRKPLMNEIFMINMFILKQGQ